MSDAFATVVESAAAALFEARRSGTAIDAVPGEWVPQTLADAYSLQDALMRLEGPAGGWKVLAGGVGEPMCAPIPKSRYHTSGAALNGADLMIVLSEVEVAVTLGQTLGPKDSPYTPENVAKAIVSVQPALEMCASSFADAAAAPHLLKLGDLQSNAAVIVGLPVVAPADLDYASLPIALRYDGVDVAQTQAGASWQEILEALAWLADHVISRGLTLNDGDVIITGARIKHAAAAPLVIVARVADMPPVHLTLT